MRPKLERYQCEAENANKQWVHRAIHGRLRALRHASLSWCRCFGRCISGNDGHARTVARVQVSFCVPNGPRRAAKMHVRVMRCAVFATADLVFGLGEVYDILVPFIICSRLMYAKGRRLLRLKIPPNFAGVILLLITMRSVECWWCKWNRHLLSAWKEKIERRAIGGLLAICVRSTDFRLQQYACTGSARIFWKRFWRQHKCLAMSPSICLSLRWTVPERWHLRVRPSFAYKGNLKPHHQNAAGERSPRNSSKIERLVTSKFTNSVR